MTYSHNGKYNKLMIILHILLAVASLVLSSINLVSPSEKKSGISYSLAAGTLATGALLIIVNNASVIRTCFSGIVFFAIVTLMNKVASHKLAANFNS